MGGVRVTSRSTLQELIYDEPDNVTVGNTTTVLLAADPARRYVLIVNDSDETMYLAVGTAAVMNKGIRLSANGGSFELLGMNMSMQSISGICTTGGKNAVVQVAI